MPEKTEKPAGKEATITNLSTCKLTISGVSIEAGESKPVPDFNKDTAVNAAYLKSKMITDKQ